MLYIIGNGTSRNGIDLDHIGRWWGCNGVFRDYTPELLFAIDIPIQSEIIRSGYYKNHKVVVGEWEPIDREHLTSLKEGFPVSNMIVSKEDDNFVIQGDDDRIDFLGFNSKYTNNLIPYSYPNLKNLFCGMGALGYAMETGEEEVCLIGFDALENGKPDNIYEGTKHYLPKYTLESRVIGAQQSQFIALLENYKTSRINFGNPIDGFKEIEYTRLYYYESSNRWILGEGLEFEI